MSKPPSIKDVAKTAQVSVGTASNVLNHPHLVSASTRKRVEEAISQLGFVPSDAGRRLRAGNSRLVGLIVLDIANPFFTQSARGIENRLASDNCYPMICSSDGDANKERKLIQQLASQQVRGVIMVPSDKAMENVRLLQRRKIPVVFMDYPSASAEISSVSVDDETGAATAITYLLGLGHRQVGFINGPKNIRQARARHRGVIEARNKVATKVDIFEILADHFDATSGAHAARELIRNHPDITAVFCASDQLAIGAMRTIRQLHLSIPNDISVVGFDDIAVASELITPLTTIRQPMNELGNAAANLLLSDTDEPRHISFVPKLIVRESTAAI
ncbi:LacI family DNA-binding transcriptional regulator [Varibaculum massiliense]|uniref:LacI family DNA-binding transcriptional regulator n=1 Tax=Varibaculum massiliense TaxID=1852372 RepID=UPI00288B8CF7|nr:LacI family DNA-binding transcriptional regulator [Varibaculum massiliense]